MMVRKRRLTGFLLITLGAFVAASLSAAPEVLAARESADVIPLRPVGPIPGQYIVTFRPDVINQAALAQALAAQYGFTLRHTYEFALRGFAASLPARVAELLARLPWVASIEPDLYAHTLAQTVPTGVSRIGADMNPIAKIDGADERVLVDVAVIDTGIDLDHPDLNVVFNKNFCTGLWCLTVTNGGDDNGHGTHVAGTAGALDNGIGVVGVAPGARLWALKVLDRFGSGSFSNVIAGIDFVTQNADKIVAVNMSFGGQGKLDALRTAIQNSVGKGVVYVVAAGNSAKDVYGSDGVFNTSDDFIPAAYPEVAAVSAMGDTDGQAGGLGPNTRRNTPDDTFADFTNFSGNVVAGNPVSSPGRAIDLAAPGVDILSTWNDGGVKTLSGTSMAAPHVAGAVAIEIAANGRAFDAAGVAAIRQALIDKAQPQSEWGPVNTKDPDPSPEGLALVASGPPPSAPPTVSISSPPDGAAFGSGETILFEGTASDLEDGDLTANLVWTSSLDGQIGTGGSFSRTLSDGTHTITGSITDSGGTTGTASIEITVGAPPPSPQLQVTVTTAKPSYVNFETVTITVTVTNESSPVQGAAVHLDVTTANGRKLVGDGTTNSSGAVTFQFRIFSSLYGVGTYTAVATASKNGFTSGSGSTTFKVTR